MKKFFSKIEEWIALVCLVVMSMLTFANVVSRYVFKASFSFSEELTTYLFVLLSLVGAAIAAKRRAHLGLSILTDSVSENTERYLKIFAYLISALFSVALFYYGILMVKNQIVLGQVTVGMQWPEWVFGLFVPIGAFFITIRFAQVLIETIKCKEGGQS